MTDEIDLDEFEGDEEEEETTADVGDSIWESGGDSPARFTRGDSTEETADPTPDSSVETSDATDAAADSTDVADGDRTETRVPHVPYADSGKPAGVPMASGGSGGGAGVEPSEAGTPEADASEGDAPQATGPHGETADDLTLAFTYEAVTRVADPAYVFSDANTWADWLGIVGDVPTPAINKFQRDHGVDADFFNGSGTGPRERLRGIDAYSMFDAERFVLVGCPDAEEADWAPDGWEFLPLSEAAEKAGWSLR